jgi:hypothetical protein
MFSICNIVYSQGATLLFAGTREEGLYSNFASKNHN